jgi:hypothetical protein
MRDWLRLASAHQHSINAQRSVDAAPTILAKIEDREKVLWKKRRADGLHLSGMPAVFQMLWKKNSKLLIL